MEVLRIGNYLPSEFLADTNRKQYRLSEADKFMPGVQGHDERVSIHAYATNMDQTCPKSENKRMYGFCKMVELDFDAIANAVELPYNNGILKGTVNRIKNIKRMMFGKAGERLVKMKLILNSST